MPRDHFSQMYRSNSHRHDQPHDSYGFDNAVGTLCGMLYSIITLKAFFPKSPAKISDAVGYGLGGTANAPYPMPQIAGDKEEQNNPIE